MPLAIASKSISIATPYPRARVRSLPRYARESANARGGLPAVELRVPRAAVLEERTHGAAQILGREQLRGFGPHRLVGRRRAHRRAPARAPRTPPPDRSR